MLEDNLRKSLDFFVLNKIYTHLADDVSKEIFETRLMYGITRDRRYISKLILSITGEPVIEKIKENKDLVLFGGGIHGKLLLQLFGTTHWKYIIDNEPKVGEIYGIPVLGVNSFFKDYKGENIVVSSPKYYESMKKQLNELGVSAEKIINWGEMVLRLRQKQYFDLEYLKPSNDKEVFIDVGCYDAMSSKLLCEWHKEKNNVMIYAFEADKSNISKCREGLKQIGVNYVLEEKGVWSSNSVLNFNSEGTVASRIDADGKNKIDVVSLDDYLKDEKATFIKMDIEGAELEALKGAEQQIRNNKPKLAICIYHKPNDIWEIPQLILEYNPDYKLYLRHYSVNEWDTVLYAI